MTGPTDAALPRGKLADIVTYLEMTARPLRPPVPAPAGKLALMRAESCTVSFYRYLYGAVGEPWLWFERRLAHYGHRLRLGDAGKIRAKETRKQKHDRRDAELIARLLREDNFPDLKWVPTLAERDQRQLLMHRHKLVRMRAQVKNQLQHIAMNQGQQKKRQLWTKAGRELLEHLQLEPWTARRRDDLLRWLDLLNRDCESLEREVEQAAEARAEARLLMTHPGIGPVISLAFVLTIGDVSRFRHSNQVASYVGLIPREHSSGGKQRLGAISKQGNRFLRQLLVEAAQTANRLDEGFRKQYQARCHHKPKGVAKVAAARKLAVRLYWMMRQNVGYPEIALIESSSRVPLRGKAIS